MKLKSSIAGYYIIPFTNNEKECMIAIAYKDKNGRSVLRKDSKLNWPGPNSFGNIFCETESARLTYVDNGVTDKMKALFNNSKLDSYIIKKYER